MNQTEVEQYALDNLDNVTGYLKIPSISAQNKGINETNEWLIKQFTDLGAAKVEKWTDQGGNPVIYAEFKGKSNKTVLFYNHYDVQPPEPLDEWRTKPFEPTIIDDKMFARGVCDDKGELMSRLTIVKYFNEHGGIPVNLKFFVEGEEEIGSPDVDNYVKAHADQLKADVCVWKGGGKDENDNFEIVCGAKGVVSFNLHVKTAAADLHSSLASYADNAAWRLVQALSSLRTPDNRIAVDGFYDDIQKLTPAEEKATQSMDFDAEKVKENYGLTRPFIYDDPREELVNGTTMTINGLNAGYTGEGVKTIIPKEATAKLDCRLAPNQQPKKIAKLISDQLVKNGFDDVKVDYLLGEDAARSDLEDPFIQLNVKVANDVYTSEKVRLIPNMPGGGPMKQFQDSVHVPIVMVGIHYAGSHPHSPNENIRLSDYKQGTYFLAKLLNDYK
ncbi:M20/M25/M40 family metallo-hydrolase [Lentilactobacillus diolivorans]|uniref:M20/M25/M40 family metallo-hydrolase n=1 Tax=Lentilactobacillus diolivorans TaxID=179838 RepID=UPI0024699A4C|nr:M20/M25/M40 family metallo-hydrolase [Lentilactobacillus diolivorans]MDH5106534.1 M20/M25/M40 family metallo-hydrolase [Lentilactobacillus diolivorans]